MTILERATDFIWRDARLLERAQFAHRFLDGPAEQVRDVVRAYRNADGGFGSALEPDVRGPVSQPLHVQRALEALRAAGVRDPQMALGACEFLASVALEDGSVPVLLPNVHDYPRASYWEDVDSTGGSLNPTAALVGLLWYQGVEHRWLGRAAAWCWQRVEEPIADVHTIGTVLTFLRFAPEGSRADALAVRVAEQSYSARFFKAEPGAAGYGLTPLHLVPSPDAPGRSAFPDALIEGHLDNLAMGQQEDGGWPIAFTPASAAAALEWRGVWTLDALTVLRAYGRI